MNELKDKPFVMIGVNSWSPDFEKLKEVMIRERLNWRSFADSERAINRQWNQPATPAFYVIDHKGIIRRRWIGNPGTPAIDAALVKLITEAEAAAPGAQHR